MNETDATRTSFIVVIRYRLLQLHFTVYPFQNSELEIGIVCNMMDITQLTELGHIDPEFAEVKLFETSAFKVECT